MSIDLINTLAEIQRLCNRVCRKGEPGWLDKMPKDVSKFTLVPHPTEDFSIPSDGEWYIVTDEDDVSLYKLR